jgi:polyhydroxyalkanoate synthesis regulator phasin
MADRPKASTGVPDAVRRAVARTIQNTLGPASLSRERAQELADDMLRRAEDSAARAGRGVREAGQRPRSAAVGVSDRVREAITELRRLSGEDTGQLRSDLERLRQRVDELERSVETLSASRKQTAGKKPASKKPASKKPSAKKPQRKHSG